MFEDNATLVANSFPKHAKYKFSGVDWLGEVPEHWEKKKIKLLLDETSEKGHADAELLSVTQSQGVVPRTWFDARTVLPTGGLDGFKFIREGEFAISLRSFQGGIEICHHDGIISPAYTTLRLVESQNKQFWRHLFKSHSFIQLSQLAVIGIREGKTISYPLLRRLSLSFPPIHEQKAIVNFLDSKTKEIEEAIEQKQRTIELLEEYKHSLIEQAVTKGLDQSAPMKDSGVDWLGEVPMHWDRYRLKKFLSATKTLVGKDWEEYDLLSLTLNGVILRDMENPEGKFPSDFSTYQVVKPGQLILCLFDVEETPRTVGLSGHHGMITGAYDVFDLLNINARFFYYWYLSLDQHKKLRSLYRGLRNTIPMPRLQAMDVFLPDLGQQQAIVEFLDSKTKEIEEAKSSIQVQIDHLKEYKDSLIENAVTGKIKVA